MTAGNYALDPMIAKKRGVMVKWLDWLEAQVQQAIHQDQSLLDPEHIGRTIFRARYGDDRYELRLARVEQRGIGIIEYPFAGKKKTKIRSSPRETEEMTAT